MNKIKLSFRVCDQCCAAWRICLAHHHAVSHWYHATFGASYCEKSSPKLLKERRLPALSSPLNLHSPNTSSTPLPYRSATPPSSRLLLGCEFRTFQCHRLNSVEPAFRARAASRGPSRHGERTTVRRPAPTTRKCYDGIV